MRVSLLFAILALPAAACAQAHNPATLTPETGLSAAIHGAAPVLHSVAGLHESIKIVAPVTPAEYADEQSSDLDSSFGSPSKVTSLTLTKWSSIEVPAADADAVANKSVAVKMIVNGAGQPELLELVNSVNPEVDQIALNTVKEYRFNAATIDHKPVDAPVVVTVSFDKK